MGVPIGDAHGDYLTLLQCECDNEYETDETMANGCPECGRVSMDIISDDYSGDWR